MIFPLVLKNGSRYFHMICELVYEGESVERFRVSAKNNTANYIVLQSNRPLIRKKFHLKTKRITWKVTEGTVRNTRTLEEVIALIEEQIEPPAGSAFSKKNE